MLFAAFTSVGVGDILTKLCCCMDDHQRFPFCLSIILCFLLSNKAVKFAQEYETTMQIVEAFVWTFGNANSIMLSSLLLLLLFADMPFIRSVRRSTSCG